MLLSQEPPSRSRRCKSSSASRCRRRCHRSSTGRGGLRLHAGRQTLFAAAALALIHAAAQGTSASSRGTRFDPYALNGGLVAAVAGPDYCILAADTRLTDGGYQIQSRRYLDGRIWAATTDAGGDVHRAHAALFELDGSLRIPAEESAVPIVSAVAPQVPSTARIRASNLDDDDDDDDTNKNDMPRPTARRRWIDNPFGITLVGSAGCASDCEALKRTVRAELAERCSWIRPSISASTPLATTTTTATATATTTASTVATLLLHTLYSRRPFPYYSFCVLAGLDPDTGTGQVHVYDAIGSHERVAVACAGTPGREMLQPILDRMFTSATTTSSSSRSASASASASSSLPPAARKKQLHDDQEGDVQLAHGRASTSSPGGGGGGNGGINQLVRDGTALEAKGQRTGTLSLRPPVGIHVNCAPDEAVAMLVKAYRSVSEREIGTGDDLVVCVLRRSTRRKSQDDDGRGYVEVMRFPLKKH